MELLLPMMIIALIALMFLQSSKQRKAVKALRDMQDSLSVGDRVMTTSGLYATIVTVGEETIGLELAPGVRTQWDRRVIREKVESEIQAGQTVTGKSETDASGSQ